MDDRATAGKPHIPIAVFLTVAILAAPDCKRERMPWQQCADACAQSGSYPVQCVPGRIVCDRAGLPVLLGR